MHRALATAGCAVALAGCVVAHRGGPAAETGKLAVRDDFQTSQLEVPADAGIDFALCPPGFVLVPTPGGVAVAGWSEYVEMAIPDRVDSLGCDADGNVLFVRTGALWRRGPDDVQDERVIDLPKGTWHVVSSVARSAWLWGRSDGGAWVVLFYDRGEGLGQALSVSSKIGALAAVGLDRAVVAVGKRLLLLSSDGTKEVLADLDAPPDGLAMMPGGALAVSTAAGITSIEPEGGVQSVATGLHGPLLASYTTLFVLSARLHAVVRLAPP